MSEYRFSFSFKGKNIVSSDIKAAINAAFKFLQKKGLVKKRTDVYNNKYKDSMSLIRERRLYENKEPGYNEQN